MIHSEELRRTALHYHKVAETLAAPGDCDDLHEAARILEQQADDLDQKDRARSGPAVQRASRAGR